MSKVLRVIENCSVEDQIAALLYLGWTHEEIATAVNVSKGTVQNRRTALEGGNLRPPPEAFDSIRTRERELHRLARDANATASQLEAEITDRMSAIADLEMLDIGPDGEVSYDDLVGFATLIAGQLDEFDPQKVVARLAPLAHLLEQSAELSERALEPASESSMLSLSDGIGDKPTDGPPETNTDVTWGQPGANEVSGEPDSRSTVTTDGDESERTPDGLDLEQQFEPYHPNTATEDGLGRSVQARDSRSERIDRKECLRRGGRYDDETGICRFDQLNGP